MKAIFALVFFFAAVSACTPHFVNVPGGLTLEYAVHGSRTRGQDVVVALHGFTDAWYSYYLLMQEMPHAKIYSLSLPCYGDSTKNPTVAGSYDSLAEVVIKFMDAMHIDRAVLIGHSMSSVLAPRVAALYPSRVSGVVMMGSFSTFLTNPDLEGYFAQLAADTTSMIGDEGFFDYDYCYTWQAGTTAVDLVPASFLDGCVRETMKVPGKCWLAGLDILMTVDNSETLASLTQPVLVLYGTLDFIAPSAATGGVEAVFEQVPNLTLIKLTGIGHAPHWEDPSTTAVAISDFMSNL